MCWPSCSSRRLRRSLICITWPEWANRWWNLSAQILAALAIFSLLTRPDGVSQALVSWILPLFLPRLLNPVIPAGWGRNTARAVRPAARWAGCRGYRRLKTDQSGPVGPVWILLLVRPRPLLTVCRYWLWQRYRFR